VLNDTSKLEGREWLFEGGCVRGVGWRNRDEEPVGFANSGGLVFMDESAEEIPTL
jgi:hypothetical protein